MESVPKTPELRRQLTLYKLIIPDMAEEAHQPRKMITTALIVTILAETRIYLSVAGAVIAGTDWSGLSASRTLPAYQQTDRSRR